MEPKSRSEIFAADVIGWIDNRCFLEGPMTDKKNSDYFARRANQEGLRSLSAADDRVSAAHAEMAERYQKLAQSARSDGPALRIVGDDTDHSE